MGALGCCDRESVHNNVDSPEKPKIQGKNDPIISISPKGTQSINFNSKNYDELMEKSKNRRKEREDIDKESIVTRNKTPYQRNTNLITKEEIEKKKIDEKNEYTSNKLKTVFNDKDIEAGERVTIRNSKAIHKDSYQSNRKTRETAFREKLDQENKVNSNDLKCLNLDVIGRKTISMSERGNKKQEDKNFMTEENLNNKNQPKDENYIYLLTAENEILIPKELENDFVGKKEKFQNKDNLKSLEKDDNENPNINNENTTVLNCNETQPTSIEHQNNKAQISLEKDELFRDSNNKLNNNNIILIDNISAENSFKESKQLEINSINILVKDDVTSDSQSKISNNLESITENLSKTISQPSSFSSRMKMFEKKTEDRSQSNLNKSSAIGDKKNIFEKNFSIQNIKEENKDRKPAISLDRSLQASQSGLIKNIKTSSFDNEKKDLSSTMQTSSFSKSQLGDRIKYLEIMKQNKPFGNSLQINVYNNKIKNDIISEEEEAFLKKSLQSMSQVEEDNVETEKQEDKATKNKMFKHKKSIRINKIAIELEKHLLNGNGKVNPEVTNILQNDEYVHIINDKPINKNKRKINRQEFI